MGQCPQCGSSNVTSTGNGKGQCMDCGATVWIGVVPNGVPSLPINQRHIDK